MTMQQCALLAVLCLCGFNLGRAEEINVALASNGAVVAADSEFLASPYVRGGERAAFAIDGKWTGPGDAPHLNRWHSQLEVPHPHWLWVRFRAPARIGRFVLHRADAVDQPVDFVAEFSRDGGKTFQALATVTGNRLDAQTFALERRFEPVVTDNFRLRITRSSHVPYPNSAQISELEVFGEFASAPAGDMKVTASADAVEFKSRWLRLVASRRVPRITELCWDSAGEGKVDQNLLKPGDLGGVALKLDSLFPSATTAVAGPIEFEGTKLRYSVIMPGGNLGLWELRVELRRFEINARGDSAGGVLRAPPGLQFSFAVEKTPVTALANPSAESSAPLPVLLHAPDFGTLLVRANAAARLECEAIRSELRWNATIVLADAKPRADHLYEFPADRWHRQLDFEVVSAASPLPALADELKYWPRYGLNAFQYRPDLGVLANNIVSDNAIFCLQMYADCAAFAPGLGGVEPMAMARESLERYFAGAPGYGATWAKLMTDVHPTVIITAWDVIRTSGDLKLLQRWISELERRADETIASDRDHNGLPESERAGLPGKAVCPTSNWWDQINFGHEDAYGGALAYRALGCLADLERLLGCEERAARYDAFAQGIRRAYFDNFFNPATGVLAGWKDTQGRLHDYYFTFVNGIAIINGLVPSDRAGAILDRLQAKIKEVGFTRFDLGLPGNLIPIRKDDYGPGALGSPKKDDGTDTFGVFENGGASACFAYYYIQALYQSGRRAEADAILTPMLQTYAVGGFQNGVGHGGEWRRWTGAPSGYEGYLPDAWFSLLALFNGREGVVLTPEGFRLAPWAKSKGKVALAGLRFMGQTVNQTR